MHRKEVYALKNDNRNLPPARFITDRLFSLDSAFCRLYDNGLYSHTASLVKRGFLTLSTRVMGVFLFTLGIYSFLIALLITLFTDTAADSSSLYGGAALAISSVPLLFSKGNVSTILSESRVGGFICDQLNIRRETLDTSALSGHSSIAFVLGVVAGTSTILFPLSYVLCAIAFLLIFCVILTLPEAGITFMTVLLFITDIRIQYALLGTIAASYIFKLIRRKRRLYLTKTDLVLGIFFISAFFGTFLSEGEGVDPKSLRYSLLLSAYFLCVCLIRDRERLLKLLYAAIMTGGACASLYILAKALSALLSAGIIARPELLFSLVCTLPIFKGGFAPLAFATLIPICAAFIIKPQSRGYRFSSCTCLVSMAGYLIISGELAFALVAIAATALFLLVTGSRWVYLAMSSTLCGAVVLIFSGSFGNRIYRYVMESLTEAFTQARDLSYISQNTFSRDYAFCGQGFNGIGETGSNFYVSLLSQLGVAGFVILCTFLLFILAEASVLIIRTYRATKCEEAISRFPSIGTPVEARACVLSLFCALLVCIVCATFCNFFADPALYLWFFMLCGFCAAYARGAKKEIDTAEGALNHSQSPDRCHTQL